MIHISLRNKYDIEQYVLLFPYSFPIVGIPTILVETYIGAAGPPLSVGLPVVTPTGVLAAVTGGHPGNTYKVMCEAVDPHGDVIQVGGYLTVLKSEAVLPPGSGYSPLTQFQSTPPYPLYFFDNLIADSEPGSGAVYMMPLDHMELSTIPLDGLLKPVIVPYSMEPEDLILTAAALDGILVSVIKQYSMEPESLRTYAGPLNGTLVVVLLRYFMEPEDLILSATPMNGTLA